jgi:hypothetical protein
MVIGTVVEKALCPGALLKAAKAGEVAHQIS